MFDPLSGAAFCRHGGAIDGVRSGACSSGEEPYTIAMVLAEHFAHRQWEVFASDISLGVLAQAHKGEYALERARRIPPALLQKYCLKGVRSQEGKLRVVPELRQRVRFAPLDPSAPTSGVGLFAVIFLRHVMIYFDAEAKRNVVENLLACLKPGGYFTVGHSESLHGMTEHAAAVRPKIYRKPA